MSVTVKIDTRRPLANGLYPLRYCITHKGRRAYFKTGISAAANDFIELWGNWLRDPEANATLKKGVELYGKALKLFEFKGGSPEQLTEGINLVIRFLDRATEMSLKNPLLLETLRQLLATREKAGTRRALRGTISTLAAYFPNDITLKDITGDKLETYINGEIRRGLAASSVASRFCYIRQVFYFSGERTGLKLAPPSMFLKSEARPLTRLALFQLLKFEAVTQRERTAQALFLLSFYLMGAEALELCRLRASSVDGGRLWFGRGKTAYSIKLQPQAVELLESKQLKGKRGDTLLCLLEVYKSEANLFLDVNVTLRSIAKRAGGDLGLLWETLSIWFARSTWEAFALSLGIEGGTIAAALKGSESEAIDVANEKVINYALGNL